MTKAELQVFIDNIDTGGSNTALEMRTTLEGFRDNVYPTPVVEDSTGTHVITTPNSDFSYDLTFTKIGRSVRVSGEITSNISYAGSSPILAIDTTEYETTSTDVGDFTDNALAYNNSNGNLLFVHATNDSLRIYGSVTAGETYHINLTYNAKN